MFFPYVEVWCEQTRFFKCELYALQTKYLKKLAFKSDQWFCCLIFKQPWKCWGFARREVVL